MTVQHLNQLVHNGADARFDEVIERLLLTLRHRHTHQCWRKECNCEYCRFINGQYIQEKLALHNLKKRIRHYEYLFLLTEGEMHNMLAVESRAAVQKWRIKELKGHKKELQKEIL